MFRVGALQRDWRSPRFFLTVLIMLSIALLVTMRTAFAAATPASAGMANLAWVLGVGTAVVSAVIGVVGKWILAELQAHTKIASNSALLNDFSNAVALAAQFALDELSSVAAHNMSVSVKSEAVANGINSAGAQIQAAATALGYTPAMIASAVSGEVAKVLTPPVTSAEAPKA